MKLSNSNNNFSSGISNNNNKINNIKPIKKPFQNISNLPNKEHYSSKKNEKNQKNKLKNNYLISYNKNFNFDKKNNIFKNIINNPQYVFEYKDIIYTNLLDLENKNIPNYQTIFKYQNKISYQQRIDCIRFINQVNYFFSSLQETFFLSINILDRFICNYPNIEIKDLNSICCSTIFIANKFEEVYIPLLSDFIKVTNNNVKEKDVLKWEYKILSSLDFEILTVSPLFFLERTHFISDDNNKEVFYFAQLLLEILFYDINFMKFKSSIRANSVYFISRKIIYNNEDVWNNKLKYYTGYNEKDLKECIKEGMSFIKKFIKNKIVKKFKDDFLFFKYDSKKYFSVSDLFFNKIKENNYFSAK